VAITATVAHPVATCHCGRFPWESLYTALSFCAKRFHQLGRSGGFAE